MIGIVAYIVALILAMTLAPRRMENIRQVVDLPWTVFAYLPAAVASAGLLPLDRFILRRRFRLLVLIGYCVAVGLCAAASIQLLRRFSIGKF